MLQGIEVHRRFHYWQDVFHAQAWIAMTTICGLLVARFHFFHPLQKTYINDTPIADLAFNLKGQSMSRARSGGQTQASVTVVIIAS